MTMRVKFAFSGYQAKLPHPVRAALEELLGVPLEQDRQAYTTTKNVAAEGEPPEYVTEDKVPADADEYFYVNTYQDYEGDLLAVRQLVPVGVGIEVKGMGDPKPIADLAAAVQRLEARIAHSPPPGLDSGRYVNTKVDVHVPGNALLAIDEVKVFEDACSDMLGDQLAEGWRIVAVCPQPDQRRPDYVLGRRRQEALA